MNSEDGELILMSVCSIGPREEVNAETGETTLCWVSRFHWSICICASIVWDARGVFPLTAQTKDLR